MIKSIEKLKVRIDQNLNRAEKSEALSEDVVKIEARISSLKQVSFRQGGVFFLSHHHYDLFVIYCLHCGLGLSICDQKAFLRSRNFFRFWKTRE